LLKKVSYINSTLLGIELLFDRDHCILKIMTETLSFSLRFLEASCVLLQSLRLFLKSLSIALTLVKVVGCFQEPHLSKAFFITSLLHCVQTLWPKILLKV